MSEISLPWWASWDMRRHNHPRRADGGWLAPPVVSRYFYIEVRQRPLVQARLDDFPRLLEPRHQFIGSAGFAGGVFPARKFGRETSAVLFSKHEAQPVKAAAKHVRGELPDCPLVRGGAELDLFGREWSERFDDSAVLLRPAVGERLKFGWTRHGRESRVSPRSWSRASAVAGLVTGAGRSPVKGPDRGRTSRHLHRGV